jgi:transcriptional regulator with XRE-family HTH domain
MLDPMVNGPHVNHPRVNGPQVNGPQVNGPQVNGPQRRDRTRPLLRTTLGEVLRRTRQRQRRTLADVARAAKVSMPYLSEVERGRKEVSSEVLAAICDALDVKLADVLVQVGRDLVTRDLVTRDLARRARVYRLDVVRGLDTVRTGGTAAPPVRRSGDAQCVLAA